MSGVSCLYRRSSGIYAVRIVIPRRLRTLVGKGEVHASTGLHDLGAAKLTALKIQTQWREKLMVLDIQRLASAGALLHGEGMISIPEAAGAMGLSVGTLLSELRNARAELFTQANHWQGWSVVDIWDVEQDYDGTFVMNDVERRGTQQSISSTVRAFDALVTISALMAEGIATESVFRLSGQAGFWPANEVHIPLAAWMTSKPTLERIRSNIAGALPPEAKKAAVSPSAGLTAGFIASDTITVKHGRKRFSEVFELCKAHRNWGLDQRRRMTTEAGLFIELMDDPELGSIEVETIHEFANRLGKLPSNIYQCRRNYDVHSLTDLMSIAEREGLERKNQRTVKGHVSKIAEILNYAKQVHNRQELMTFMEDELGLTVTRASEQTVSVKFPGAHKAVRLRGAAYEYTADYKQITSQSKTDGEQPNIDQAKERLAELLRQRAQHITDTPKTTKRKEQVYGKQSGNRRSSAGPEKANARGGLPPFGAFEHPHRAHQHPHVTGGLERNLLQTRGGKWSDSHGWNNPKNGQRLGDAPNQPQQVVQLRQDAPESGARAGRQWWGRPLTAFNPLAEIDEQIRALSIQLNDCPLGSLEAKAISDQLNVLQGVKQSQYGAPSPAKKFKPR